LWKLTLGLWYPGISIVEKEKKKEKFLSLLLKNRYNIGVRYIPLLRKGHINPPPPTCIGGDLIV
jgi:hypothetical protein